MNHLEQLIFEYYDWQGYIVKHNIKVGKRDKGGWTMELDILAYNRKENHVVHLEPSIDAHSWATREKRFKKKFDSAREYIFNEVFTWLDSSTTITQYAILISHPKTRGIIGGGIIKSVDELTAEISDKVIKCGKMSGNAIPEQYPLLRTIQLVKSGYYGVK